MKQIDHFTGTAGKQQSLKAGVALLLMGVMLQLLPTALQAQVLQPFTQRASDYSPDMPIYHIKGDYTMTGNTNVTFSGSYSETSNNSSDMKYVDVDRDTFPTINSSTAALTFSEEFGANPACSEVVYAGLYWTGRTNGSYVSRTTTTENINTYSGETGGGYTLTIEENGNDRIFTFTKPGSDPIVLRMTMVEFFHDNYGNSWDWTGYNYYVHNISNGAENQIYDDVPRWRNENNDPNQHLATLDDPVQLPGTNYTITQLYWNSTPSECYATVRGSISAPAFTVSKNNIKISHSNAPGYT